MKSIPFVPGVLAGLSLLFFFHSAGAESPGNAQWKNGPPTGADYFPIAVWSQSPGNAARYKAAGFNLYVGLWQGPTQTQLDALAKAGMPVICEQKYDALANLNNPIIIGWMHGDEPDDAQALPGGKGYGPPIMPDAVIKEYAQIRAADSTRPVMLNLDMAVAWDQWPGRGVRTNHPEDYPEYLKGCDIVSFDIYPVTEKTKEIAGKLEYDPRGVQRLVDWTHGTKAVWNCIECTHIGNPDVKATPDQVRSEVWMSLIAGSRGLIYFVHQFAPSFKEAALLDDPEMLAAVTKLNAQIHSLAPVINSPTIADAVVATPARSDVPVSTMVKKYGSATYLFAAAMRNQPTQATFKIGGMTGAGPAEVLDESRTIPVTDGQFTDAFQPYGVHIYRITAPK